MEVFFTMLNHTAVLPLLLAAAVTPAFAHAVPRGEAKAQVAGKAVTIEYGRPSLQGRDMIGRATPGEPWRMGADAATTLKTEADLSFGGVAVAKGSYILTATKDQKDAWTLNIRDGSHRETVIANVPLETVSLKESVEMVTIGLTALDKDKGEFELRWGTTGLRAAFTGK